MNEEEPSEVKIDAGTPSLVDSFNKNIISVLQRRLNKRRAYTKERFEELQFVMGPRKTCSMIILANPDRRTTVDWVRIRPGESHATLYLLQGSKVYSQRHYKTEAPSTEQGSLQWAICDIIAEVMKTGFSKLERNTLPFPDELL